MIQLQYLGHAGFVYRSKETTLLIDPWFYPAFLNSWFPLPNNRFLEQEILKLRPDYLYISHTHEDHYDLKFLEKMQKNTHVICPNYLSNTLEKQLRELGFESLTLLKHKESTQLDKEIELTMYLDISHKEDSGILIESQGHRFLNLNDCNTRLNELPENIDVFAAQFSGAMWYPNCYDYPESVMQVKVDEVRASLMRLLIAKTKQVKPSYYLPSAGPPIFLDPELEALNDLGTKKTIFPTWNDMKSQFKSACPNIKTLEIEVGSTLIIDASNKSIRSKAHAVKADAWSLESYREERKGEWECFQKASFNEITTEEIKAYSKNLQRKNWKLTTGTNFHKQFIIQTETNKKWYIQLGKKGVKCLENKPEEFTENYTFTVPEYALRQILDETIQWEEALLSGRIKLHRNDDVFDMHLMSLLRYGGSPKQIEKIVDEQKVKEMIENKAVPGLRHQRYCPHAGEDLVDVAVCNGVIECPRHHWKWDVQTGKCIEGGDLNIKVEHLDW